MPEQTQIDSEFQDSEIERRLARLESLINAYEQGGFDIFRQFGYLQFDGIGFRWDTHGMQVKSGAASAIPALYFVQTLVPDPSAETSRGKISGYSIADGSLVDMEARANNDTANVFVRTDQVDGTAALVLDRDASTLQASLKLVLRHFPADNWAVAKLSKASLSFESMTGDPDVLSNGMLWYNQTDNKLYARINGATVALGGGGMSLIVKEADETVNNSTTLQNDNELLFAVAANEVVQFEGVLMVSTDPAADFKLTFTGPAGAVGSFAAIYGDTLTGNADASSAALGSAAALVSGNDGSVVRFWGGIHNGGTAGNLTLQWAQNTANVSDSKVLAGSYLKWQAET